MSIAAPETQAVPKVAQLAIRLDRAMRELGSGWVEGEVQKLRTVASGHTYFDLVDADAKLDCCLWRSQRAAVGALPKDGDLVQVHYRRIGFYAGSGTTSLHVDTIRPTGDGELLKRKQETLARLQAEGLCNPSRRRPLPWLPRRVGLIAGPDAKADVIQALRDRFPAVHIVHRAATVQGVKAVDSIIEALGHLQGLPAVDIIIVARGGGDLRQLMPFDDERLCRAITACAVPVVTSIAHTKQVPNCDHVADCAAHVPGRAAEVVVPSAAELLAELDRHAQALAKVPARIEDRDRALTELWSRARPRQRLERLELELNTLDTRLGQAAHRFFSERRGVLDTSQHRLASAREAVPRPEALDLQAEQLRASAERFFGARERELDASVRELRDALQRVPRPETLNEARARLDAARARARRDAHDYLAALDRRGKEARRHVERRLRERERELTEQDQALGPAARRRLVTARTQLDHMVQLVEAKDPRRRGYVLVADKEGRPARSASALSAGDIAALYFHDGTAEVAVRNVNLTEGEGHE